MTHSNLLRLYLAIAESVTPNHLEVRVPALTFSLYAIIIPYYHGIISNGYTTKGSNALGEHHPNLLAVNFLLSEGFQLARSLPKRLRSLSLPNISPNIDALTVSVVGIDERLTKEKLIPVKPSEYALDEEKQVRT